jgi:acetoacetyl-CoA synthetase
MAAFESWLGEHRGLSFADHTALWRWSVEDLEGFWSAIWEFFDLRSSAPYTRILENDAMPGAIWCPGAMLNYTAQIMVHADRRPQETAVVVQSETFGRRTLSWARLRDQVASMARHLAQMGVTRGDRVVAILPNTDHALVAFLATASLGAIWSICAPDMGQVAVLDRFQQIKPKVLIGLDRYVHAGRETDRSAINAAIAAALPSLSGTIVVDRGTTWDDVTGQAATFAPLDVPFDHPLWVVYSSGTTGTPKPIVHGHGGILLEAAKQSLHHDLTHRDRFCWLTSSGWIMWNAQWMALGQGACVALFDGAPGYPDLGTVWQFAARERLTFFGAGAAFFISCMKAGLVPDALCDLGALRSIGSTGSPLPPDAYDWIYGAVKSDVWLAPISGGTDLAGAFVLGHPMLPVRRGWTQTRALGNAVQAFDEAGRPVTNQVGELVCTAPLPSMPLFFWGDQGGTRLHDSYFDTYPGVWRHGDWIEIDQDGASVIYGRSDATINRRGLRMGSSEIYQAVESLPAVLDSLVVDLEVLGSDGFMPLFVVLAGGQALDSALKHMIHDAIRDRLSARFLPDEIIKVADIPRTLSGKKLEIPVKKLLLGGDPDQVVNRDSMVNPESFDRFIAYAATRRQTTGERPQ